jgi:ribonuclease HII
MARVIEVLRPDMVYVDASDVLEERFKQHILECMSFRVDIVSEHKADRNYVAVSAASIIAKTERDKEISELAKTLGDFGSGYPSDPRTMKFLKECCEELDEYPDYVRKSWKPAKRVRDGKGSEQTKLM